MIRVFLLAVVGLLALVMIAGRLPAGGGRPPGAAVAAVAVAEASSPARWDGTWEGSLTTYRADGTPEQTASVRCERQTVTPTEQRIVITERWGDGRTRVLTGSLTTDGGQIARRLTNPDGTLTVYTGRKAGAVLFWHHRDELAGVEESLREEIVATPGGDLYTVDGFRLSERGGRAVRLIEGRYHRAARDGQ
jgi:hypothetical protein